jgi:hypothetical protein
MRQNTVDKVREIDEATTMASTNPQPKPERTMNHPEFKAAVALAKSDVDLSNQEQDHFYGFGLPDFEPVVTTIPQVARLIRWQAQYMNGEWDMEALNEVRECGRRRFLIVD